MRALIILMSLMGVAIVVAFGFVVYGIQRNLGGGADDEPGFGDVNLGLPSVCELAEASFDEERILIRTTGLAERGCQQVIILDSESGRILGRIQPSPAP